MLFAPDFEFYARHRSPGFDVQTNKIDVEEIAVLAEDEGGTQTRLKFSDPYNVDPAFERPRRLRRSIKPLLPTFAVKTLVSIFPGM